MEVLLMRTSRSVPIRTQRVRRLPVLMLSAVVLSALPVGARAQTNSIPVLGGLPLIGRLYQTQSDVKVPILGDLPILGKMFRVRQNPGAAPDTNKTPLVT